MSSAKYFRVINERWIVASPSMNRFNVVMRSGHSNNGLCLRYLNWRHFVAVQETCWRWSLDWVLTRAISFPLVDLKHLISGSLSPISPFNEESSFNTQQLEVPAQMAMLFVFVLYGSPLRAKVSYHRGRDFMQPLFDSHLKSSLCLIMERSLSDMAFY